MGKTISGNIGRIRLGDEYPVAIMGVINLAGNSFYPGSVRRGDDDILCTAKQMEKDGASIIDVGARSTAPYRKYEVSSDAEKRLLQHAVALIAKSVSLPVSVDTTRIGPARAAIEEGASILNDVYGLTQNDGPKLARLVSAKNCSLLLTAHERRKRLDADPMLRVSTALENCLELATTCGVDRKQIVVDPGIGFFSDPRITNVQWNCTVLDRLSELRKFKEPICVGLSRKRFIGVLSGDKTVDERLSGSLAATAIAVYNGAHIIRTHDVRKTLDAVRVAEGIRQKGLSGAWNLELKA
ncbi:MAG: dihydropteroate synthase [Nitrososphaerales archaeon]